MVVELHKHIGGCSAAFLFALALLLPCAPLSAAQPSGHQPLLDTTHLPSRTQGVRLIVDGEYFRTLTSLIRHAEQRIDLAMFLFKAGTSERNRPLAIAKELIRARKRGVQVRVLLEYSGYNESINKDNQRVAKLLRKNRIEVAFDSAKRTNHTKLVVVDRRLCLMGSHNLTNAALTYNHELSLLLDSPSLARDLLNYMDGMTTTSDK